MPLLFSHCLLGIGKVCEPGGHSLSFVLPSLPPIARAPLDKFFTNQNHLSIELNQQNLRKK